MAASSRAPLPGTLLPARPHPSYLPLRGAGSQGPSCEGQRSLRLSAPRCRAVRHPSGMCSPFLRLPRPLCRLPSPSPRLPLSPGSPLPSPAPPPPSPSTPYHLPQPCQGGHLAQRLGLGICRPPPHPNQVPGRGRGTFPVRGGFPHRPPSSPKGRVSTLSSPGPSANHALSSASQAEDPKALHLRSFLHGIPAPMETAPVGGGVLMEERRLYQWGFLMEEG